MNRFNKYRRKQIAELRKVSDKDLQEFKSKGYISTHQTKDNTIQVSISDTDKNNGSPKIGDMIARNPNNHLDEWLVAEQYFKDNFEQL